MKVLKSIKKLSALSLAVVAVALLWLALSTGGDAQTILAQTADTPTPVPTLAQPEDSSIQNLPPIKGKFNPPQYPNMDSNLNRILEQVQSGRLTAKAAASNAPFHSGASVAVRLYIIEGYAQDVWDWLEENGADPRNIGVDYVEAYIPVSLLVEASQREGVITVHTIIPLQPAQGAIVSEGAVVHGAPAWNAAGFRGQGVKVGIIEYGFESFQSLMGTELPSSARARCYTDIGIFSSDIADCYDNHPGSSEHGTAVTEAVFDIAPDAVYYIATIRSEGDLKSTVEWMIEEDVDVINMSLAGAWNGPGDGTSPYSWSSLNSVDTAVAGGIVWVNSAGNAAGCCWLDTYSDADSDNRMEFNGSQECNKIEIFDENGGVSVKMRWEDPWGSPDGITWEGETDLDLFLFDANNNVVASSEKVQHQYIHQPSEFFHLNSIPPGTYCLEVHRILGPNPAWAHLWIGIRLPDEVEFLTPGGSIVSPAESANPGLLAVGAASWKDTNTIASYSSRGPTTDGRIKPDIVGAANGNSAIWGPWGGTSQASPHVAGLAALVKQRFPDYSPQQVAQYLKDHAEPRGNVPNNTWGYGFAKLPASDVDVKVECRSDCQTLLVAKDTLIGNGDADLNWDASIPMFDWEGVSVDAEQRVTRISLAEKGLSGEISPDLGSLSNLTALNLDKNQLTGEIPAELLGNLPNLSVLSLKNNRLTGTIPPELGKLSQLTLLNLEFNQLTGTIPAELGNLSQLTLLNLFANRLTGTIPAELGNLSKLKFLTLTSNRLTGAIPAELGNLSNLKMLQLHGNRLTGTIPAELGNLSKLDFLALNHNRLTGTIPAELGNLSNLENLYLSHNQLTGCIPVALRDVTWNDLEELTLPFCDDGQPGTPTPTPTPTATPTPAVPEEVLNRISALETLVATLQGIIDTLQSAITTLDSRVTALEEDTSRPTPSPTATLTPTPTFVPGVPTPTPAPTSTPIADACVETISGDGAISGEWKDNSPCTSKNREEDSYEPVEGAYSLYYTFTLNEDSDVKITLESEVDTYLYLLSGAGRSTDILCKNDDHHDTAVSGANCESIQDDLATSTDSGLAASLDKGSYTIEATTYESEETGKFMLSVSGIQ